MNIHTFHVMTIHTLSTIRHYSFPLAVNPVNCYVVCYMDSLMLCRFELFFLYLSVTVLSLAYLFLNYFCYVYTQIHSLYVWSYMCK